MDDRAEFKGAHAGHAPGAPPNAKVTPVDLDVAQAAMAP
jgi:putative transposase